MTLIDPKYYDQKARELAAQGAGPQSAIPWKEIEDTYLSGPDYYTNPDLMDLMASIQAGSKLSKDDPRRLEATLKAFPGLSADSAMSAINGGFDGDIGRMVDLANMDAEAARRQAEQERLNPSSDQHKDVWDNPTLSWIKGLSRVTFAALEAPFQLEANLLRVGQNMLDPTRTTESLGSQLALAGTSTDLGVATRQVLDQQGVDTGDGFFMDGTVRTEVEAQTAALRSASDVTAEGNTATRMRNARLAGASKEEILAIRDEAQPYGVAATYGRDVAGSVARPGTAPYGLLSGAIDLATRVADPSMYVGAGAAKGAGQVWKAGAKGLVKGVAIEDATVAGLRGGKSAANMMREQVFAPKRRIYKGAGAARPYGQAFDIDQTAEVASKQYKTVAEQEAALTDKITKLDTSKGKTGGETAAAKQDYADKVAARVDAEVQRRTTFAERRAAVAAKRRAEADNIYQTRANKALDWMEANLPFRRVADDVEQNLQAARNAIFGVDKTARQIRAKRYADAVAARDHLAKERARLSATREANARRTTEQKADLIAYALERKNRTIIWNGEELRPIPGDRLPPLPDKIPPFLAQQAAPGVFKAGDFEILQMSSRIGNKWVVRGPGMSEPGVFDTLGEAADHAKGLLDVAAPPKVRAAGDAILSDMDNAIAKAEQKVLQYTDPDELRRMGASDEAIALATKHFDTLRVEAQKALDSGAKRLDGLRSEPAQRAIAEAEARADEAANVLAQAIADGTAKVDDLVREAGETTAEYIARRDELADKVQRLRNDMQTVNEQAYKSFEEWVKNNKLEKFVDLDEAADAVQAGGPEVVRQYLDTVLGRLTDTDGGRMVVIDNALDALFKGDADPVVKALYQVVSSDSPTKYADLVTFSRGKIPEHLLRPLKEATSEADVKQVLMAGIGRGDFTHQLGRMRMLRTYTSLGPAGRAVGDEVSWYARSLAKAKIPQLLRWSMDATKKRVPWSYMTHIEDAQGMLWMVNDSVDYMVPKQWGDAKAALKEKYVSRMIDAGTGPERKRVLYDMLDEVAQQTIQRSGLLDKMDAADGKELVKKIDEAFHLSKSRAFDGRHYNADLRSILDGAEKYFKLQGKEIGTGNMPLYDNLVNEMAWVPNPKILKRVAKNAERIKKNGGDSKAVFRMADGLFDQWWRTAVLVFKPSYIMRNILDGQIRMFLSGHSSLLTHPFGLIAMATNAAMGNKGSSATKRMLRKMDGADTDLSGTRFAEVDPFDAEGNEALQEFQRTVLQREVSMLDVSPDAVTHWKTLGAREINYQSGAEPAANTMFWEAKADELYMAAHSTPSRYVLQIELGRTPPEVADYMAEQGIADAKDALVHMALYGPLRKNMDDIGVLAGPNQRKFKGNQSVAEHLRTVDGVTEFLWGEANPASYVSTWRRRLSYEDGNGDRVWATDAINMLLNDFLQRNFVHSVYRRGEKQLANDSRKKQAEALGKVLSRDLSEAAESGAYTANRAASPLFMEDDAPVSALRKTVDWFFNTSARFEKAFMWSPEYRMAYWDAVADLVPSLSKADAQKALAQATESLRGSHWSKRTLKKIDGAVKKMPDADDGFALTFDEASRIADRYGAKQMQELFYDAAKRNRIAHALRYIFPFAQAWANSLRVWGRESARNSQKIYKAGLGYQAGRSEDTNWIYKPLGVDDYDPTQGVFFQDPRSGKINMFAPGPVQWMMESLTGVGSGAASVLGEGSVMDAAPAQVSQPIQSFNLLFQNGFGPGFGPLPTAGVRSVAGSSWYQNLPDVLGLKTQIEAGGAFDDPSSPRPTPMESTLESMVPQYAKAALAITGVGFGAFAQKYESAATGWLFSSNQAKYVDEQGALSPDGAKMLRDDARALAKGMAFGQAITKTFNPGSVIPKFYAKVDDGQMIPQAVLIDEWKDLQTAYQGDSAAAWQKMSDKYGTEPLLTLIPVTKEKAKPTGEAWRFYTEHGDEMQGYEEYLPLFMAKGSDYSIAYGRYLRDIGKNARIPIEDRIKAGNSLLKSAQASQIRVKYAQGLIDADQRDMAEEQLKQDFADVETTDVFTASNPEGLATKLEDMLQRSPDLRNTNGGRSVAVYLELRREALKRAADEKMTLGEKDAAPLRAWLWDAGEQLAAMDEDFKSGAWWQLRKEIS